MMKSIRVAAASAAVAAAALLPLAAPAASVTGAQPQHYTLQTELVDRPHAGAYEGTLTLNVYPDGIVNGFYRPADGGIREVDGGLNGTSIWLDIGGIRSLHLTGTFKNGVLRAIASMPGPDLWEFNSVPIGTDRR